MQRCGRAQMGNCEQVGVSGRSNGRGVEFGGRGVWRRPGALECNCLGPDAGTGLPGPEAWSLGEGPLRPAGDLVTQLPGCQTRVETASVHPGCRGCWGM